MISAKIVVGGGCGLGERRRGDRPRDDKDFTISWRCETSVRSCLTFAFSPARGDCVTCLSHIDHVPLHTGGA